MAGVSIIRNTIADNNYDSAMDKAVEQALVQAGMIIVDEAVARVPVGETGRLRGSITYATKKEAQSVGEDAEAGDEISQPGEKGVLHSGSNVEYAPHVEYGTKHMEAQPYLVPALQERKDDILRDFGDWVEEYLRRGK